MMTVPTQIQTVYKRSTCLHTKQDIDNQLDRLAKEIHETIGDKNPLLLCVMIGGLVLGGNLLPRLDFPLQVDYIHATRYRGNTTGQDELTWKAKPTADLANRTVLIIEDILDQGVTLQAIIDYCHSQGAKEVLSVVLLDKRECRIPGGLPTANFTGIIIPDAYVFGYGLDYKNYLRNAPGIYMVAKEDQ
jgi:hypoxanthine phosphoribosyltransferase